MASRSDDVILEREFFLLPKRKGRYRVTICSRGIYFSLNANNNQPYEESLIKFSDIVGCHCLCKIPNGAESDSSPTSVTSSESEGGNEKYETDATFVEPNNFLRGIRNSLQVSSCGVVLFAYPFVKKKLSSKQIRQRQVIAFEIPSSDDSEDDVEKRKVEANKWCNVINCLCRDIPVNSQDLSKNIPPERKRWLFLINPFSGPGKAYTIFKQEVAPLLYEASIPYKAIVTAHAGHASELVKSTDLSEWYGVVIVSGDGLIFETINGIMQRDDWATSLKTPIGCLPGGSGNALCCSINYAAGEPVESAMVLHSTFILVKHRIVPMDLVAVHLPDRTLFSFLSITWGIMADIDYESEKYRNLGETRFTVGAVNRILGLRTYKGRVSFLPIAEYVPLNGGKTTKVLSKVRRFSLRSRSSSKATLSSQEDDSSAKLTAHRSYSVDETMLSRNPGFENPSQVAQSSPEGKKESLDSEVAKENQAYPVISDREEDVTPVPNNFGTGDAVNVIVPHADVTEPATDGGGDRAGTKDGKDRPNGSITADSVLAEPNSKNQLNGHLKEETTPTAEVYNNPMQSEGFHPQPGLTAHKVPCQLSSEQMTVMKPRNCSPAVVGEAQVVEGHVSPDVVIGVEGDGGVEEFDVEEETYTSKKADFRPVPTPLLPQLEEPVPSSWVVLEDDFILVLAVYQTHLGSEMLAAPDARLQDGLITLMMVRRGVSKAAMFRLFLSFSQGNHVSSPHVEIIKVLAFRLEPLSPNGNIMVDGERFNPAPIQAQILPGLARVMAIR